MNKKGKSVRPPGPIYHRVVVKLGTSLLTGGSEHLNHAIISSLVTQIARLHERGQVPDHRGQIRRPQRTVPPIQARNPPETGPGQENQGDTLQAGAGLRGTGPADEYLRATVRAAQHYRSAGPAHQERPLRPLRLSKYPQYPAVLTGAPRGLHCQRERRRGHR